MPFTKHFTHWLRRLLQIVLTGFLLAWILAAWLASFPQAMQLLDRPLPVAWQLHWMEPIATAPMHGFKLGSHFLTQVEQTLYVDAIPVLREARPVQGAIVLDHTWVVATDDRLWLLDPPGGYQQVIDAAQLLPPQIQNIGLFHGEPVLQTRGGMWRGTIFLNEWQRIDLQGVTWSELLPLPEALQAQIQAVHHQQLWTWRRLIQTGMLQPSRWRGGAVVHGFFWLLLIAVVWRGVWWRRR